MKADFLFSLDMPLVDVVRCLIALGLCLRNVDGELHITRIEK